MKAKTILALILSGFMAFSASAADFGGKLYIEDATIVPGGTTELSIQLDNNIDVSGFQLQMILPTGIAYQSCTVSEERLPVGASVRDVLTMQRFRDHKLTIASVLNCGSGAKFTKMQGEIATLTLTASPNVPEGTYVVEVHAIDICDPMGNDYDIPVMTFTLTVGEPSAIDALHSKNGRAQIYDLQGRSQNEVSSGQAAIVNGRAVYRK